MKKEKTIEQLSKSSISKSKYYVIDFAIADEKKDLILEGTLFNKNKESVDSSIFYDGKDKTPMADPYLFIVDHESSMIKNRRKLDKLSMNDFVVSPNVQKLFSDLKIPNAVFYGLTIKGDDIEIADYKILKITGDKIDCIDLEKSDLELTSKGNIDTMAVNTLVVDEKKIPIGQQLFLLGRDYDTVIVHEDLKKAIESAKLTGFVFFALEHFFNPDLIEI
jgi:hypothetical protein